MTPTTTTPTERVIAAARRGATPLPAFLRWIADRLVNVYGESANVDFVLSLRDRADAFDDALRALDAEREPFPADEPNHVVNLANAGYVPPASPTAQTTHDRLDALAATVARVERAVRLFVRYSNTPIAGEVRAILDGRDPEVGDGQ